MRRPNRIGLSCRGEHRTGEGDACVAPTEQRSRYLTMPLFDAYLMVDWSAAAVPTVGRDSIWYALRAGRRERCANLPTRAAAQATLRALLLRLRGEGQRVLVGFDFPFGYPAGFAAALGLGDWRRLWRFLA